MAVILRNNVFSTLTVAVSTTDTILVVADGSQFPAPDPGDYFYATLVSPAGTTEIVKVTARTGASLTAVRAQDGSSASNFQIGALIEMRTNAASILESRNQAEDIQIADAGGYYTGTDVEAALQEAAQAATTKIADAGSYYTGTNVEAALQEAAQAATTKIADAGSYYTGTTVEAALQEAAQATTTRVVDAGGYFASNNVEGVLQELGAAMGQQSGIPYYASLAAFFDADLDPTTNLVMIALDANNVLPYLRTPGASGPDDATNKDGSDWAKSAISDSDVTAAVTAGLASAVSRAELLASGTFTPTLTFATPADMTVNYTTGSGLQRGSYLRIDKLVKCIVNINGATITKNSASGRFRLAFADLPFTPDSLSMGVGQIRVRSANLAIPTGISPLIVVPSQKYLEFGSMVSGGAITYLEAAGVTNGQTIVQCAFEFWVS